MTDAPRPQPPAPDSLLPFAVLIGGQLLSFVGTTLTGMGIGIWVFQQTGSVMTFAWLTVLTLVPAILISPFGGVIADRWPKKPAMLAVDAVAALTSVVVLSLLASGRLEIWHLYLNAAVGGMVLGLQRPLYESTTPLMVGNDRLAFVNGIVQSVAGIGQVVAPVMAGALLTTLGLGWLLVLDLCTFVVALACILAVRVPNAPRHGAVEDWFTALGEGWRFVRARPGLLAMFWFTTVRNYLFATCEVVIVPMLLIVTTAEKTGAVLSVGGLGVIVGGLLMGLIGRSRRLIPWVILAQGLTGAAMIVGALTVNLVLVAAVLAVAFLAFPIEEAGSTTVMQRKVPAALLGRVASVRTMMAMSAPPLAMLVTAPLADRVFEPLMTEGSTAAAVFGPLVGVGEGRGMALILLVAGAVTLAVTVVGWGSARLRNLESELPDQDHPLPGAPAVHAGSPAVATGAPG